MWIIYAKLCEYSQAQSASSEWNWIAAYFQKHTPELRQEVVE